MDETDLLKMAGLSTTGVAILLIAWRVFKSIQGKKVVSTCCGHKGEVGVSVVAMSPLALREVKVSPSSESNDRLPS
jgi:hypothetical protein